MLIRQLLAFSRQQVLAPRVIDALDWLRAAQRMLVPIVGGQIELAVIDPPRSPGRIRIDPAQLDHVLVNLVANARDTLRGSSGRIVVELDRVKVELSEPPAYPEVPPGEYVRLQVSDDGVGMPPDVLEHIFEPFFSTKARSEGTGLGLATVHGIVRQSGGHLWAESEPGAGSAFHLYFPRVDDPLDEERPGRRSTALRLEGAVLVVEDQAAIRTLLRALLENAGLEVHEAAHGREALDLLQDRSLRIDLLLADVVMPGMHGREIARLARQQRPTLRVAYMSGYSEGAVLETGRLEPGAVFLQKPISQSMLLARLRELLA
ncbi:MAG TPA: ATP-binding protein [Thermoanaerobaculia bacterium]|nr:ATP-binding protein [Thermoanaerobaculia bacterium]